MPMLIEFSAASSSRVRANANASHSAFWESLAPVCNFRYGPVALVRKACFSQTGDPNLKCRLKSWGFLRYFLN